MEANELHLTQDLFREEFPKLVSIISRTFSLDFIETAEDLVSETFLQALETWKTTGIPENPRGWLYVVARQKTLYHFRRNKILTGKVLPAVKQSMDKEEPGEDYDKLDKVFQDSQLQMIFAVCDPVVSSEAQIALALRILCGFTIDEIAEAFFSNKETISKRLVRAKDKMRGHPLQLEDLSPAQIRDRIANVLHVIYLLFSEGYYSSTSNKSLRKDFCLEAIRLGQLLTLYPATDLPETNALMALMCFHTSRFDARQGNGDDLVLYDDQNPDLWEPALISRGEAFLEKAAAGEELSSYHLEAGIAFWHCQPGDLAEKWEAILYHYDLLLQMRYAPEIALNRLYALYKAKGAETALEASTRMQLPQNHFYYTLLGELYSSADSARAFASYEKALALCRSDRDRRVILEKMKKI